MIVELPTDSIAQTDAGWNALDRFDKRLASDPRCDRVISITTIAESNRSALSDLSRETRRTFLSSDGRAALLEVLPATFGFPARPSQLGAGTAQDRRAGAHRSTRAPRCCIGGIPALNADYQTIVVDRFRFGDGAGCGWDAAGASGRVPIALRRGEGHRAEPALGCGLLRSIGFGLSGWTGSRFLGVHEGTGSVFPLVPIVAFAIVFGLSMDYEVFLVARVLEARRSGLSEMDAIPEGMARTAGLITSAAAIMIVVFAAFTFGSFLVVKMIGFTLAVAVFIDATLVRIVIGPALLRIAGDWNWWPGGLAGERKEFVPARAE